MRQPEKNVNEEQADPRILVSDARLKTFRHIRSLQSNHIWNKRIKSEGDLIK